MSNLSRLSDLPNKPVNIVYLQSGNSSAGGQPPSNHSYNVTSSNGWNDGSRHANPAPVDYHTMPTNSSRDSYYTNTPSPYHQQQHQQQPYRSPQGPPSFQNTHNPQYDRRQQPAPRGDDDDVHSDEMDTDEIASLMATLRMKMEEKRERMEKKTSRMKAIASQKLGKAAYLKAMNNKVSSIIISSVIVISSLHIIAHVHFTVVTLI